MDDEKRTIGKQKTGAQKGNRPNLKRRHPTARELLGWREGRQDIHEYDGRRPTVGKDKEATSPM